MIPFVSLRLIFLFLLVISFSPPAVGQNIQVPPAASQSLTTLPPQTLPGQTKPDLLFILDSSGSMAEMLEGQKKIDWAKKAIAHAVAGLPSEAEVGLRVYAHRIDKANRVESCRDTELIVPLGAGKASQISTTVQLMQPMGWTPIAYSLQQVENDFSAFKEREHTIILVSDGEETCGGDAVAVARDLLNKGYKFKIFTVGFNVDDVARKQLEALAQQFGGSYTDARSGLVLQQELTKLTQQSFLIQKQESDNRIRGGDSIATAVSIEPNKRYRLDHHQRKGYIDHFKLTLYPSQQVQLHLTPVKKCLIIAGEQSQEDSSSSFCNTEAFHLALVDSSQTELMSLKSDRVSGSDSSKQVNIAGDNPNTFYLLVGSLVGDMHRDHEFVVQVQSNGDANTDYDAGNTASAALPITPGLYEKNSLSIQDPMDYFKVQVTQGASLKVVVTALKSELCDAKVEILGELGEIIPKVPQAQPGVLETTSFSSPQSVYIQTKTESCRGSLQYSLGIALRQPEGAVSGIVMQDVSPPPMPEEEKLTLSSTEDAQKIPLKNFVMVSALLLFISLLISGVLLWKKRSSISSLGKSLGWYQIVGGVVGLGFGNYLVQLIPTAFLQIFLYAIFVIMSVLGIVGGGLLLSGRSDRVSLWWGILQIPWVALNLHWAQASYSCAVLLGLPVYFIWDVAAKLFRVHFGFNVGIAFEGMATITTPGEGFSIGMGMNLIAVIFTGLILYYRRRRVRMV
ncbi:MAG: hypothetical protein A3I05_03130 [Deltaproteobacteria bacterium RIFCSPLOWO2_02_FULL_44_10]|nr:MAG: hypothetical protein A3C46_08990 [Deltaproteobacteria bacterium RIFCSPHIGHO2_02_FULL_44_16]OGQ46872.1 MAG: hypothetical protein A3I05_03130 [Deltaproteobacteria bacterium RIFCSPLOWO2_02_FULL_44_10]